ncbi:MAG: TRAM domain-containing protein, partial [Lachnospiraceae bacterium]|nr:TRAM domain-containing protein [Lachnospiraceae bacterium]
MKKNDVYEITIEDIGNDGEGIGHIYEDGSDKGIAVFVKDAVIGDVASVKLIKVKKNYAYGRLMEVITPSPY